MIESKNTVDFYWDPVCPWCWITSRWMVDVGRQKRIKVNWHFFSLKKINKGRHIEERFKVVHKIGLRALRVAAAVRKELGNDGVGKIYTAIGARYHHDRGTIDKVTALKEVLSACGFPPRFATAANDSAWDKAIEKDMAKAIAKAGTDVGVPLIVLDGGKGPGFFGPVMSPAPTGKDAVKLWDAVIAVGLTPGFFELKRTRETGPLFGERPVI